MVTWSDVVVSYGLWVACRSSDHRHGPPEFGFPSGGRGGGGAGGRDTLRCAALAFALCLCLRLCLSSLDTVAVLATTASMVA